MPVTIRVGKHSHYGLKPKAVKGLLEAAIAEAGLDPKANWVARMGGRQRGTNAMPRFKAIVWSHGKQTIEVLTKHGNNNTAQTVYLKPPTGVDVFDAFQALLGATLPNDWTPPKAKAKGESPNDPLPPAKGRKDTATMLKKDTTKPTAQPDDLRGLSHDPTAVTLALDALRNLTPRGRSTADWINRLTAHKALRDIGITGATRQLSQFLSALDRKGLIKSRRNGAAIAAYILTAEGVAAATGGMRSATVPAEVDTTPATVKNDAPGADLDKLADAEQKLSDEVAELRTALRKKELQLEKVKKAREVIEDLHRSGLI